MSPRGVLSLVWTCLMPEGGPYVWTQNIFFLTFWSSQLKRPMRLELVHLRMIPKSFTIKLTTVRAEQPWCSDIVSYCITWWEETLVFTVIASDLDSLSRNRVLTNVASSSIPTGPCISVYHCLHESLNSLLKDLLSLFLLHYNDQPMSE